MNQLKFRACPSGLKQYLRCAVMGLAKHKVVAEPLGQASDQLDIIGREGALELSPDRRHQNRRHANLEALIEILVPGRKADAEPVFDLDLAHGPLGCMHGNMIITTQSA